MQNTKTRTSQKTTTKSSKKLSSEMIASMPSLSHVLEMGFTVESVEHALNELGEDTRAERLVSWLLQHPEVQKKVKKLTIHVSAIVQFIKTLIIRKRRSLFFLVGKLILRNSHLL